MDITGLTETCRLRTAITAMICLALGGPGTVLAEGISGYAEYNYSLFDSKMTDTASRTMTKSNALNQRYSLAMDKNFTPTLRLSVSGLYERNSSDNDTDGLSTSGTTTRINPTADLAYSNGVFNGGLGFSRRQETIDSSGAASTTTFFDTYNARFGWKPEDLPSLDILYSIYNNYDEHRISQDSTTTTTTLSSRYRPVDSVDINYTANYSTLNSKLAGFETQSLGQSLRLTYNDVLFNDRIAVSTSYNIATQDTKSQNNGSGNALLLLSPKSISQLYFATTTLVDLSATSPLLGGPSMQNAVPSVSGTMLTNGATPPIRNNIGIQSNFSEIDTVRLPVVLGVVSGHVVNDTDRSNISQTFVSRIKAYQSPGSDGTNWRLLPGASATFGSLTNPVNGSLSEGFEIKLGQTVAANTIIKIEIETVQSISGNVFIQSIALATPEAYQQENALPGQSKTTSQISGLYNLNVKARLLNVPILFYDFGLNLDHTKSDSQAFTYRYTLVNGLSLNHRFTPTLSISTRIAREDTVDPLAGSRSSNIASVSLSSQTLPTLTQSATYGFRQERESGVTKNTHSINISNSAELYRGISFSLIVGGSMADDTLGQDQKNVTLTSSLNLLPHKTLSINLTASESQAWTTTVDKPKTSTSSQTGELTVTFTPVPSIYLLGSYTIYAQSGKKTQTIRNLGASWSPFRGGSLLLNSSYRESLDNMGNKDSNIVQSLRWNIRSGWYLDVSYLISTNTATTQKTDTNAFNTSLRMSF